MKIVVVNFPRRAAFEDPFWTALRKGQIVTDLVHIVL